MISMSISSISASIQKAKMTFNQWNKYYSYYSAEAATIQLANQKTSHSAFNEKMTNVSISAIQETIQSFSRPIH